MVMRLAVSNIAWRATERDEAHAVLAELGVPGLEIAPGLAFADEPDPFEPSDAAIRAWRTDLERHGLSIVSMQSLLFGVSDAALFGSDAQRTAFETGVGRAIDLAGRVGCPNLVLGSPTARRIPDDMAQAEARRIAKETLRRLGDRCLASGATLALEPNPELYGTNFLNTFAETIALARALDHPAITVNFDIGALILNGETEAAMASLPVDGARLSHVHVSEPHLAPAPAAVERLAPVLSALDQAGYQGWTSIEMRSGETGNIERLRTSVLSTQAASTLTAGPQA